MPMNSDKQFESTFSDLAMAVLQDKSPSLIDYLLGFQILDVNDEQTKAVGVFGCKVGNEFIYLPCWFMNGELKGFELMYLKNQDIFCPNNEAWVNYVLNRKPYKLGDPSEHTQQDLVGSGVDIMPWRASPENFGKTASTEPTGYKTIKKEKRAYVIPTWNQHRIQEWTKPFSAAASKSVNADNYKQASARLDLVDFMSNFGPKTIGSFVQSMTKNASFGSDVLRYYPVDKITAIKPRVKVAAELNGNKVPDVKILSYNQANKWDVFGLSDADKRRLQQGELVVKDHRNDTSKVYKATVRQTAQTPNMTGAYDIITETGELIKCFVILNPITIGYGDTLNDGSALCCSSPYRSGYTAGTLTKVIAINLDGSGRYNCNADSLFGNPTLPTGTNYASEIADFKTADSAEEGSTYAIVGANGTGTSTFYVLSKTKNADDTITLFVTKNLDPSKKEVERAKGGDTYNCSSIIVQPRDYGLISKIGDTIFVPKSAKLVPVKINKVEEDKDGYKPWRDSSTYDMPKPGNAKCVESYLWRNNTGVPLKLYSTGQEFQITVGNTDSAVKTAGMLTYGQALNQLVHSYGVQGDTAQEMLKTASKDSYKRITNKYYIKFASGYPNLFKQADNPPFLTPGMTGAPMMDPSVGQTSDPYLGVPMMGNISQSQPVQGMRANQSDLQLYNPDPRLDQNIYNVINNAAQTGQKEVFDTAMIAGLVKSTDSNKLIDKYIGDLILGMDRIGRIYFLFLQHNENFESRYGQEDMIDLEDSLRNTFKGIGDLILFLKQKTVEANPSVDRTKISLGGSNKLGA